MLVDSDSLGSYLRQERERQRVSLQDIAAATKIQLKFLEALESDAYDQLPAAPFVVGFLRACIDPDLPKNRSTKIWQTTRQAPNTGRPLAPHRQALLKKESSAKPPDIGRSATEKARRV